MATSSTTHKTAILIDNVVKTYHMGKTSVRALDDVSVRIQQGQFVAVMGASGSGKSTLMHIIAGLSTPDSGSVTLFGNAIQHMNDDQLTKFRRNNIGLIFQSFNLMATMTAVENVSLPLMIDGKRKADVRHKAVELLASVGLGNRVDHRPDELSGGQQQRVAIARALANDPLLLLADEPTGNLDTESGERVLDVLKQVREENGTTIALVTHDTELAAMTDRVLHLVDGQLLEDDEMQATLNATTVAD